MMRVFPDPKTMDCYYKMTEEEGELIYKVLGRLSLNDLKDRDFNKGEIDKIHSIYYSF